VGAVNCVCSIALGRQSSRAAALNSKINRSTAAITLGEQARKLFVGVDLREQSLRESKDTGTRLRRILLASSPRDWVLDHRPHMDRYHLGKRRSISRVTSTTRFTMTDTEYCEQRLTEARVVIRKNATYLIIGAPGINYSFTTSSKTHITWTEATQTHVQQAQQTSRCSASIHIRNRSYEQKQ
jgi:hypothetical protein